jgi:hypothetical protein
MADTPPDPDITFTRTLRVELEPAHLEYILKEWAKTRGFSHRVDVTFECCNRATLTETFTGGGGPEFPFQMNPTR